MLYRFLAFIVLNDVWILFLCILAIVWYLAQFLRSQRQLSQSMFYMERDRAAGDRGTAIVYLFLFIGIAGGVIFVNTNLREDIPAVYLEPPTPTPDMIATRLATPETVQQVTPIAQFPTATPLVAPTATLRDPSTADIAPVQVSPTPSPLLEVEPLTEGCTGGIYVTEPQAGDTVVGGVSLFGTADTADFNYYKLEIIGPHTFDQWQFLSGAISAEPVNNAYLGGGDLSTWETGIYQLRLTVVDSANSEVGSCLIQVGVLGVTSEATDDS